MSPPPSDNTPSTRPYLLRALHEWCSDNGFTPYIAVHVDRTVQVPMEFVKNQEIVLNVGFEATAGLKLGNDTIEFRARFGGVSRDIVVPVDHVVAIYARENGQGMAFPLPTPAAAGETQAAGPGATEAAGRHGLHLASVDGEEAAASPAPPHPASPSAVPPAGDDEPPTPPRPPADGRPSLKRIK